MPAIGVLDWITGRLYMQLGMSTLASKSKTGFRAYIDSAIICDKVSVNKFNYMPSFLYPSVIATDLYII